MPRLEIHTPARETMVDVTDQVRGVLRHAAGGDGILHLWSMHTTCGLTVNEGYDPDVVRDLVVTLRRVFPREGDYRHAEGNSDSHLKTAFMGPGLTLLVERGELVLGPWQRVFLCEWDGPRTREVAWLLQPVGSPQSSPPRG